MTAAWHTIRVPKTSRLKIAGIGPLGFQIHPPQQVLEARVVAEGV